MRFSAHLRLSAQLFAVIFSTFVFQSAYGIELSIVSSTDPVQAGTGLTITMTVSNPSSVTQTNVVLQAVTPNYMSFGSS